MGETMNGAEALVEQLRREGVRIIFGYPGGAALPIYDALFNSTEISHILVRHEQGAGHMAEGYARVSGQVGCCLATSGPGATNLVTPLTDALMDSTPIVAITGQVTTAMIGKDAFQEADVTGITMNCTKHNFLVKDASKMPEIVAQAFTIARTGRPGPVLIDVPKDMATTAITFPDHVNDTPRSYNTKFEVNLDHIDDAARAIAEAERPVLYVGGGAVNANAFDEVMELAHKTNIPVATTLMGKGAFDETDDLSMGMLGMHGSAYSNWAFRDSDLVIAIGARFDDRVVGKAEAWIPNAKIIHADIDPGEFGKIKNPHIQLLGDAKHVTAALVKAVASRPRSAWNDQVDEWKREAPFEYPREDGQLHSQYVVEELWRLTNGDSIIVTDVGQHQMWAAQYYKVKRPRQWVTSGGLGTMGYGLPAAIGAQFAAPKGDVWCITGDGSIQMCIQELIVATIYKLPVKILILNNTFLGMVRQWQEMFLESRYSEVDLEAAPDFVKLADAYGAVGIRCEKKEDVESALRQAMAVTDRPVVLDMRVAKETNVFPFIPTGATVHQMIVRQPLSLEDVELDKANIPG